MYDILIRVRTKRVIDMDILNLPCAKNLFLITVELQTGV